MDVRTDQINRPEKVLIGTAISRREALIWHGIISALALTFGFLVSWKLAIINGIIILLLIKYASTWKKQFLIGNVMISLFCGLVVLLVGWVTRTPQIWHVIAYSLFAFLTTLNREIIKDMEDMRGDRMDGCRTVPIVWGIPRTRNLLFALNSLTIVLSTLYFYTISMSMASPIIQTIFGIYISIGVLMPFFFMLFWLNQAGKTKDFSRLSRLNKWIMVIGTSSMLFFVF